MPTEAEIKKGVTDSARLEVAKKLKTAITQNREKILKLFPTYEEPNDKEYLDIADDAIGKREFRLKGVTIPIKLKNLPNVMGSDATKKFVDDFGGLPDELVPTTDDLDEVGNIAARSVKKATGPITVMGTSLFTLITSFFEAIGDLFSGKIGFGDFFGRVKEIAAERTGEAAGGNLREGMNQLREQRIEAGKPIKWLTPSAIEDAVTGVKVKALEAAGVRPEGPKPEDVLGKLDTGEAYKRYLSEKAQADIISSVQAQLNTVVTTTVGAEPSGSFIDTARAMTGFKASPQDAKKITDTVANAVAKTVGDPKYKYQGKDPVLVDALKDGKPISTLTQPELSKLLQEETQKALETANTNSGFFSFKMSPDHIKAIVGQMDEYTKTNYDMLKQTNTSVMRPVDAAAPALVLNTTRAEGMTDAKVIEVQNALKANFAAKLKPVLVESLNKKATESGVKFTETSADPFVKMREDFVTVAQERFVAIGADIIAKNPRLLEKGKEEALSEAIANEMVKDPAFKAQATPMLKKLDPDMASADPEGLDAGLRALAMQVTPQFTTFFKDTAVHKSVVDIVTDAVIQKDKEAKKDAPITGAGTGAGTGTGISGTPKADDSLTLAALKISGGLNTRFADVIKEEGPNKGQPNPVGQMFNVLTGLDKVPAGAELDAKKNIMLKDVGKAIAETDGIIASDKKDGIFIVDTAKGTLKFKADIKDDPAKVMDAYKDVKDKIAATLNKGLSTPPKDEAEAKKILMNNALAEGVALQMVDQAQPDAAKKLLDANGKVKDPAKADQFTKAQTAVAQKFIADKIEAGLNDPTTRGMASLVMGAEKDRLKLIANKAAEGIAPLVVKGANPPTEEEIRKAVDDKLKDVVPDAGARQTLVEGMAKAFTDEMSGKPVDEAAKAQKARETMALAKVMAKKQAHDGIESFKDWAKGLAAHGRLAPEKIPTGVGRWLGRHLKPIADDVMDVTDLVVSPEKRAAMVDQWTANNVRQDVMEKTIADAIVDCADPKWQYGPDKKSFADLSENEKKNVIRSAVKDAVRRDFDQIFPNQPNIGGMSIPIPPGIKDKISNEVGNGTGDSMKFAAAPTAAPNYSFASLSSLPSQSFTTGKPLAQSNGAVIG